MKLFIKNKSFSRSLGDVKIVKIKIDKAQYSVFLTIN